MHCKLQSVQMVERLPLGCQVSDGRQLWVWLGLQGKAVQLVERLGC